MSDEHNSQSSKEPSTDQTPPGTPWTNPGTITDSNDGPSPVADNE
jgi:hypothetical protein